MADEKQSLLAYQDESEWPPNSHEPLPGGLAGLDVAPLSSTAGRALAAAPPDEQAARNEEEFFLEPTGKYKLVKKGAYAAVECTLAAGDTVKTDAGAMVAMSDNLELTVQLEGGVGLAMLRSCCAGEGMFMSHYRVTRGTHGDLLLAPSVPGDIGLLHMDGRKEWALQKSAYLASDASIAIGVKRQSVAACCCSGTGLFVLKASGRGRLLFNSFGGIIRYELGPGQVRKIDNGALVAWENHMDFTVERAGKTLVGSIISGEFFVCTFTGPGTVYMQTRSLAGFARNLRSHLGTSGGGSE